MSPSVSVRLLLSQSDARLVAFARAGHERAFEALVRRYRRPLHNYCRRLLLSEERAEDALQQALLQAWLALRAGTEVGEVRPWLYRIVHNAAVNALRVSGYDYCKLSESLSGAGAPQEDLDRRIAVREALAGLAALPEMQREALLRTAVEGRSHQQVARDLGLSETALRGLVYRARATLRAAAGAITPSPLIGWALDATRGTPVVERLAELGAGGGSAGLAGLLMKGGAVAVTASVLAGGIVAGHRHRPRSAVKSASAHDVRAPSHGAMVAAVSARPARWSAPAHGPVSVIDPSHIRLQRPAGGVTHHTRHTHRFTAVHPPPPPSAVPPGGRREGGGEGGGPTQPPSGGQVPADAGLTRHGDTHRGSSGGERQGRDGSPAGGGEAREGTNTSSAGGREGGGIDGGATGRESDGGGRQSGSGERQTNSGANGSSQATSESSKEQQAAPEEPAKHD